MMFSAMTITRDDLLGSLSSGSNSASPSVPELLLVSTSALRIVGSLGGLTLLDRCLKMRSSLDSVDTELSNMVQNLMTSSL